MCIFIFPLVVEGALLYQSDFNENIFSIGKLRKYIFRISELIVIAYNK